MAVYLGFIRVLSFKLHMQREAALICSNKQNGVS